MPAKKKSPASSRSRNPKEKRDYDKEYKRDQSSEARKKYRAELNKKNRENQKAGKTSKGDGKDESHTKDVRKGGSPSGKTTPKKASTNRAWRKGKKGYDRGRSKR